MSREEFEKLEYIAEKLEYVYWLEPLGCYTEKQGVRVCGFASWVNGAWYAWQEQQKKINIGKELQALYKKEIKQLECGVGKAILSMHDGDEENALCILKELLK